MIEPSAESNRAAPIPGGVLLGLATALGALALLYLCRQPRAFGDGPLLVFSYELGNRTHHLLYGPFLEQLAGLVGGVREAAYWASALPAAGAVGLLAGALRRRGRSPGWALWAAALALGSPAVLFFGTTVEVHGLQLLGGTFAWLLLTASPSKTHHSALLVLGLGLIALGGTHPAHLPAMVVFGCGRAWVERRSSLIRGLPVILAALSLLSATALLLNYLDHNHIEAEHSSSLALGWHSLGKAWSWGIANWQVLGGLGWIAIGWLILRPRAGGEDRQLALFAMLWSGAMLSLPLAIDLDERGGYLVSMAPALASLAAVSFERWNRRFAGIAASALLLAQLGLTYRDWHSYNTPPIESVQQVLRDLEQHTGGSGVFLSPSPNFERTVSEWSTLFAPGYLQRAAGAPPELTAALLPDAMLWLGACVRRSQRLFLVSEVPLDPELVRDTQPGLAQAFESLQGSFTFEVLPAASIGGLPLIELRPR